MRAHRLDRQTQVTAIPDLANLIDIVGHEPFSASLFKSVRNIMKCEHLTAFSFSPESQPRVVLAENAGHRPVASQIAQHYRNDYWRHDLANKVTLATDAPETTGAWGIQTTASEIEHAGYRSSCYTSAGLDDRICISDTRDDRTTRINFYRRGGSAFSGTDAARIYDSALLLLALVRRHDGVVQAQSAMGPDRYLTRLAAVAPGLTTREMQVCTAIINGLSSEGIALQLNVGINTVLTYRKRAYARLGISSQNELMRLVLH